MDVEPSLLLVVYEVAGGVEAEARYENPAHVQALEDNAAHARLTRSAWIVGTSRAPADLLEEVDRHLGPADRVFIGALSGDAAWRNIDAGYGWFDALLSSRAWTDARSP